MKQYRIGQTFLTVILTSLCLVFPLPSVSYAAEDAGKQSDVFTLGEIEVRDRSETTKNVTIEKISGDEMEEFDRYRLPEALDLLPGVTISNSGGRNEKGIYVRGFSPSRVPVFLDGIPVYVPYDRTFDYSRFTTFDLSELVVSKGFTSVLYGPNTMGGAINMVTKRPSKPIEGNAGIGYSTGNSYYGFMNIGTNQNKWYLQAGASYFNTDYYPMSNSFTPNSRQGGAERTNSYSTDDKVSFKLGLTPAAGHEYAFGYAYQHGEKGQPPDTRPWVNTNYWQWPKWNKESYYVATTTPLGDKSYVKGRFYYDVFENWLDFFTDSTYSKPNLNYGGRSYYDDHTIGGTIEMGTTLIPRNNIKAAFHYKRDTHDEHNLWANIGTKKNPKYIQPPWEPDDDVTLSAGIEDTIDFTEKFYAIAGLSYDTLDPLRAKKFVTTPTVGVKSFDTDSDSTWNPQLGFFYLLSDTGKLHASVEKKTRFPTMKERYSWSFGKSIDNPALKPEKAINYEIGYEDNFFKKIRTRGTVFYNDISDAIQNVTLASGQTQNQNIAKLKQFGIEAEGIFSIIESLEGGLNFTYLNRQNDAGTPNYIRPMDVPVYKVFSYLKYLTPVRGLSVLGSLEYNSSRTSSSDGRYTAGAFTLVNAKASYKMYKWLTVEAGVNNALDRNYQYIDGFAEAGRTFFAHMRATF